MSAKVRQKPSMIPNAPPETEILEISIMPIELPCLRVRCALWRDGGCALAAVPGSPKDSK